MKYKIIPKSGGIVVGVGYAETFCIYRGKTFVCSCYSMYMAKKLEGLLNASS